MNLLFTILNVSFSFSAYTCHLVTENKTDIVLPLKSISLVWTIINDSHQSPCNLKKMSISSGRSTLTITNLQQPEKFLSSFKLMKNGNNVTLSISPVNIYLVDKYFVEAELENQKTHKTHVWTGDLNLVLRKFHSIIMSLTVADLEVSTERCSVIIIKSQ